MAARSQGPRPDVLWKRQHGNKRYVVLEEIAAPEIVAPLEVPADMTIVETEEWVGEDPERAKAALAAETERDHPRTTLLDKLKD